MTIEQKIEEALNAFDKESGIKRMIEGQKIQGNSIEWLRHQQSIIKNQAEEIERLRLLLERMDECGTTGEDASEMHMYVNEALRGSVDSWKSPC